MTMADNLRSRFTISNQADVTVFVLGLRVNRVTAVRTWIPMLRTLRLLLAEAASADGSGLLGYRTYVRWPREVMVMQYWRGPTQLMEFAQGTTHQQAWSDFYRLAVKGGAVGLWHETYAVPAGRYEAIYGILPPLGLAAFSELLPVGRRNNTAGARLREGRPAGDAR
jgi:hypothetical protein